MTILGLCALTVFLPSNMNNRCTKQQDMTLWHTHKHAQTGYMQGNVVGEGYSETHIIKRLTGKNQRRLTGDILLRWYNKGDMIAAVWQEATLLQCRERSLHACWLHSCRCQIKDKHETYGKYIFTLRARIRQTQEMKHEMLQDNKDTQLIVRIDEASLTCWIFMSTWHLLHCY